MGQLPDGWPAGAGRGSTRLPRPARPRWRVRPTSRQRDCRWRTRPSGGHDLRAVRGPGLRQRSRPEGCPGLRSARPRHCRPGGDGGPVPDADAPGLLLRWPRRALRWIRHARCARHARPGCGARRVHRGPGVRCAPGRWPRRLRAARCGWCARCARPVPGARHARCGHCARRVRRSGELRGCRGLRGIHAVHGRRGPRRAGERCSVRLGHACRCRRPRHVRSAQCVPCARCGHCARCAGRCGLRCRCARRGGCRVHSDPCRCRRCGRCDCDHRRPDAPLFRQFRHRGQHPSRTGSGCDRAGHREWTKRQASRMRWVPQPGGRAAVPAAGRG